MPGEGSSQYVSPSIPDSLTIFLRESIRAAWDEAIPLIRANHAETGALAAEEFSPDRARYEAAERAGLLAVYTARLASKLIGYAVFFVGPHLHYPKTSWAIQDVVYVAPAYRGRTAWRFLIWQDGELGRDGVRYVYRHVGRVDYSKTLEALGYRPEETRYVRDLTLVKGGLPARPEGAVA